MPKKVLALRNSTLLTAFLFVAWGFYRFLFKLPEELEEFIIKPLVWLIPVFYFLKKEKTGLSSIGVTEKNLFPSIYLALLLGAVFTLEGLLVNFLKYKELDFTSYIGEHAFLISLAISFATAISEEITFRGYLFTRLWHVFGGELRGNLVSSLLWALIHLPISVLWWGLDLNGVIGYLSLTLIFGIGSAFVYARTKNIVAPILLHVFWEWPIILFR